LQGKDAPPILVAMHFAICNETFPDWEHQRVCQFVAGLGYQGLEIAPYTLSPNPTELPLSERALIRAIAEKAGLEIVGLHWLLAKTTGLHLTHPDIKIRQKTADYLVGLSGLCADLGGSLLVLGSPKQRDRLTGVGPSEAFEYALDTLQLAMPRIAERGVRLCVEPLGKTETNFLNTCAEACELIAAVNHPLCHLQLDVKALASESDTADDAQAVAKLVRKYAAQAGHFHANDPNRRGPGFGPMDFKPIFAALREKHYAGWVSVEVFDYTPDPETIATQSLAYMKKCWQNGFAAVS
jgi:sugar phosphate isomerase/epimerase